MKVNVTDCWAGGNKWKWALVWEQGGRYMRECLYHEEGQGWDRSQARVAKDIITDATGYARSSIRFDVK